MKLSEFKKKYPKIVLILEKDIKNKLLLEKEEQILIEEAEPIKIPNIDIFPAKFLKVNENLKKAINNLFSYNVNFINPETAKGDQFDNTIIQTICPTCKSIMRCNDCYNKKSLKVTFERICDHCRSKYIFTCKYESKDELKEKYNFFVEYIYKKRAGKIE